MQRKLTLAGAVEAVMAGIVPNIAPASPKAPKINVVDMRFLAVLEHKNELVFRPVKRAHPSIRFVPNADIFQLGVDLFRCTHQFLDVTPIHADKVDGAVDRMLRDQTK